MTRPASNRKGRTWALSFWIVSVALLAPSLLMAQEEEAVQQAVEAIEKSGGKVSRDEAAEGKPLVAASLATTEANDDDLMPLETLTMLHKVTLNGTKISDAGLDHLKPIAGLQKLYLVDTKITDAGLEKLKDFKELSVLSLVGTEVTDAGMEHLKAIGSLKEVFLYGTKVTDDGAKALQEALPMVKIDR